MSSDDAGPSTSSSETPEPVQVGQTRRHPVHVALSKLMRAAQAAAGRIGSHATILADAEYMAPLFDKATTSPLQFSRRLHTTTVQVLKENGMNVIQRKGATFVHF